MTIKESIGHITIEAYNPRWSVIYSQESYLILDGSGSDVLAIEHIGSTAIPNQISKPIIDIMLAVESLSSFQNLQSLLLGRGYQPVNTNMQSRLMYRKTVSQVVDFYHLHIVEHSSWHTRKERIMRDYLIAHPKAVIAYGELKKLLAKTYQDNSVEYTKAKTEFIQNLMDRACIELGYDKIDVWSE